MSVMEELQQLQKKLQELVQSRTKLETQFQENKIVKEEFETLNDDSNVYKLMGPVLLKQDKLEAEDNVNKRLEFITSEIEKVEKNIKSTQNEMQLKRNSLQQQQQQSL
jgi:prefoldin beta subunit